METEIEAGIMALRHLAMVEEIVGEIMVMVAIQEVAIGIITEALLKDYMVIGIVIVIEEIADQEDLLGNEVAHHMEVIGIEIEREEDHEVVVLIIIEGEVDTKLMIHLYVLWYSFRD